VRKLHAAPRQATDATPLPPKRPEASAATASYTVLRTHVVRRPIDRTVLVAGGALALPFVEIMGEPVSLQVPGLGRVDVPEAEYPQIFDFLTSSDPARQSLAYTWLRQIHGASAGQTSGAAGRR
jgi:hypothetical protein